MIKIEVSESKMREIEEKHWQWFKNNMLGNWIAKMNRCENDKFIKMFFDNRKSFKEWFDKGKNKSVKKWVEHQEDEKFYMFKDLIIGSIKKLKQIKNRLNTIEDNNIKKYMVNQYDEFRRSRDQWGGAYLINDLNINVCPYCNRSFIDTYQYDEEGKIKSNAQLDHFYPKEKYPYFVMSLYNLIPCCSSCNHVKLNENENIVYPYCESFGQDAKFETSFYTEENSKDKDQIYDTRYLLGNSDNFKIEIKLKEAESGMGKKIQNSIDTFHLEALYNFHKDYVRELIKKAIIYNQSRVDELYNQYPELFSSREEVVQMVVSNYINEEDLGKRPLSKLTKDICKELGLR